MIDLSKFGGSIANPYAVATGVRGFSELTIDSNVGGEVLHVRKFQTLIQALGYFKYALCESVCKNFKIYFRGQEKAFGPVYQPSLYRSCTRDCALMDRDGRIKRQIALARKCCKWFKTANDAVIEGVLQQYGMRTRWIDAVDNIWIALWFACHHAWTWNGDDSEYIHYSLRSPAQEGDGEHYGYIYVLGFNSGYTDYSKKVRRKFTPGMAWSDSAEMLDLRYAVPSLFIRPHAQHGVLLRSFKCLPNGGVRFNRDMSDLVQGVIRFNLEDGIEWLGQGVSVAVSSVFPPPAYDSGYGDLLRTERRMRYEYLGREVEVNGYRKKFHVGQEDVLQVQKMS